MALGVTDSCTTTVSVGLRVLLTARREALPVNETITTEIDVEQHKEDSTTVDPPTESIEAVRREQPLVVAFASLLRKRHHKVTRQWTQPKGEATAIVCDLCDKTANVLYEAKGFGTRNAIRMAIGQLADYRRFAPTARRAVLLIERPRPDLEALLRGQSIDAEWRSDGGFTDNANGELTNF
jgi:hypothetical protein